MKRAVMVTGLTLAVVTMTFAQSQPTTMPSAVVETIVIDVSDERGIVGIRAGHGEGVAIGDPCWFFSADRMVGHGEVFLVSDVGSAVRLNTRTRLPAAGDLAVVVTATQLTALRDRMPAGTSIRGRLVRLPPGRRTGWIDIGQTAGLRRDDSLLVWRAAKDKCIPIARGRVVVLEDRTALLAFQPLVGNAHPGPGDDVELWPSPSEGAGKSLTSTVVAVGQGGDGPIVRIAGTTRDGLAPGRLVDLFRDGRFVGVAGITTVADPLSVADLIVSASIDEPAVGDRAVVRPPAGAGPQPIRAVVFNIQGDVCLLAAGEADGVRVGEKFVVPRSIDGNVIDVAELTIYTVKVDYAGARVRLITLENHPIQKWDFADRRMAPPATWQTVGTIRNVVTEARTAFVQLTEGSAISPGAIVRISPKTDTSDGARAAGAGIVLNVNEPGAVLFVPNGWANVIHLNDASIEIVVGPKLPER